jgi:hypothetical protein
MDRLIVRGNDHRDGRRRVTSSRMGRGVRDTGVERLRLFSEEPSAPWGLAARREQLGLSARTVMYTDGRNTEPERRDLPNALGGHNRQAGHTVLLESGPDPWPASVTRRERNLT